MTRRVQGGLQLDGDGERGRPARREWNGDGDGDGDGDGIYEVILGVVRELRPVMGAIERRDPDLARQMRRAVSSVALNTAEGMYSGGRNKGARYQNALGSMRETLACVEVGVALGYVERIDADVEDRIRSIIGTLVRLIGR